jgi:hypothetical protein
MNIFRNQMMKSKKVIKGGLVLGQRKIRTGGCCCRMFEKKTISKGGRFKRGSGLATDVSNQIVSKLSKGKAPKQTKSKSIKFLKSI